MIPVIKAGLCLADAVLHRPSDTFICGDNSVGLHSALMHLSELLPGPGWEPESETHENFDILSAMAERENSAFRLYRFIQRMMLQPDALPASQVVLNAFGIEKGGDAHQQNANVARVLGLLFTELELLVSELKRHDYSDEAIKPITAPFDTLSAGGLVNQLATHQGRFCSESPFTAANRRDSKSPDR